MSDQHPPHTASGPVDEPPVQSAPTEPEATPPEADSPSPSDTTAAASPDPAVTTAEPDAATSTESADASESAADAADPKDAPDAVDAPDEADPVDPVDPASAVDSAGSDEPEDSVESATGADSAEAAEVSASSAPDDQADVAEPPVEPAAGEVAEPLDQSAEGSGSATQPVGGQVDEPLVHSATEPVDAVDIEEGPVPLGDDELDAALEALLLVVDSPVDEEALADALDTTPLRVAEHLRLLSNKYTDQDRGIDLRRAGGGWRFYTRDRYAPYVEKFLLDGQRAKLTRAALETLAVIAYRQPVTRARVAAVRGVNCDGVIRTLLARGLVEETGTDQETGGHLYRTTELFLERLGLSSLEDLPPIAPLLPEVDSIDEL